LKNKSTVHTVDTQTRQLPVRLIDPSPYGIREQRTISLKPSVRKFGILQPITVREKDGRFQVIFGDGRLQEAKLSGLKTVPAIVRNCGEKDALLIHLTENLARENFSPLEEGKAYELLKKELGWTVRQIAGFLGQRRKKSVIAERMKLNKLPSEVKDHIKTGRLTISHIELLQRSVPENSLPEEAEYVAKEELSIEETDAYLKSQEPVYRIHEAGKQFNTEPVPAAASPGPAPFVKLHEFKITGKVEKPFSSDALSLTTRGGQEVEFFHAMREALRELSLGDELEVTVKIFAPAKSPNSLEAA
jgi:ParB family chromosome partitioning protein